MSPSFGERGYIILSMGTVPTWYGDAVQVGAWDGSPIDAPLSHVLNRQLRGCVPRAVHGLHRLLLCIVEETERVAVGTYGATAFDKKYETYPPMPQQLGSVTLSAADTATAASADRDRRDNKSINARPDHVRSSQLSPALPPFRSISSPASTASGCEAATTPFVPYTCERRLANRWKTMSG